MTDTRHSIATKALHHGSPRPRMEGAIVTPIYQSSTYEYHGEAYHDVGYLRLSNTPNHRVLARRIAGLEGTETALLAASGMAAISATFITHLSAGDHILAQDCLYAGTIEYLREIASRHGIEHTSIDAQDPASWDAHRRPNTRAIYVESISNPLIRIPDLNAVVDFARTHDLVSIIDNTFASPVNFRPAELGFDLVVESCTKFMNGHNDIVAGSVAGSEELIVPIKHALDLVGGSLDAHACFLLERGLKTLSLRMAAQNHNAQGIAEFLAARDDVVSVAYPGLVDHPEHGRARELFAGGGGVLAFELAGGLDAATALIAAVSIPAPAPSLGGVESLMVRPAAAVHSGLSEEMRAQMGISAGLIRFSVGVEDLDDLLTDLEEALESIGAGAVRATAHAVG